MRFKSASPRFLLWCLTSRSLMEPPRLRPHNFHQDEIEGTDCRLRSALHLFCHHRHHQKLPLPSLTLPVPLAGLFFVLLILWQQKTRLPRPGPDQPPFLLSRTSRPSHRECTQSQSQSRPRLLRLPFIPVHRIHQVRGPPYHDGDQVNPSESGSTTLSVLRLDSRCRCPCRYSLGAAFNG